MIRRQWFLIALALVLAVGLGGGGRLTPHLESIPRDLVVAAVMFCSTLTIDLLSALALRTTWLAAALAIALNAGVAPPLAYLASKLLPAELATGLVIAAAVPCTIASAAVWTRRGGGNDAVALLVTLVTNLASFVILPAWLVLLVGKTQHVEFAELSLQLLKVVVAPVLLAQAFRQIAVLRDFATHNQKLLSNLAQGGILVIVLIGAASAGAKLETLRTTPLASLALLLLTAAAVHLALFALGWFTGGALGFARPERIAIAVAGSQKTLAVGLSIALAFGGLAVLPMIAYHVLQLVLDAWLVDSVRRASEPVGQ